MTDYCIWRQWSGLCTASMVCTECYKFRQFKRTSSLTDPKSLQFAGIEMKKGSLSSYLPSMAQLQEVMESVLWLEWARDREKSSVHIFYFMFYFILLCNSSFLCCWPWVTVDSGARFLGVPDDDDGREHLDVSMSKGVGVFCGPQPAARVFCGPFWKIASTAFMLCVNVFLQKLVRVWLI